MTLTTGHVLYFIMVHICDITTYTLRPFSALPSCRGPRPGGRPRAGGAVDAPPLPRHGAHRRAAVRQEHPAGPADASRDARVLLQLRGHAPVRHGPADFPTFLSVLDDVAGATRALFLDEVQEVAGVAAARAGAARSRAARVCHRLECLAARPRTRGRGSRGVTCRSRCSRSATPSISPSRASTPARRPSGLSRRWRVSVVPGRAAGPRSAGAAARRGPARRGRAARPARHPPRDEPGVVPARQHRAAVLAPGVDEEPGGPDRGPDVPLRGTPEGRLPAVGRSQVQRVVQAARRRAGQVLRHRQRASPGQLPARTAGPRAIGSRTRWRFISGDRGRTSPTRASGGCGSAISSRPPPPSRCVSS